MAGYNLYSKSNNAVEAEGDGRLTATAFAKFVRKFKAFSGCTAADVKNSLTSSEWHHTSKMYNRTDYYDVRNLLYAADRRSLREGIKARRLMTSILRQNGGRFDLTLANGRCWYTVNSADDLAELGRVLVQLRNGCVPGAWRECRSAQAEALAEHDLHSARFIK